MSILFASLCVCRDHDALAQAFNHLAGADTGCLACFQLTIHTDLAICDQQLALTTAAGNAGQLEQITQPDAGDSRAGGKLKLSVVHDDEGRKD